MTQTAFRITHLGEPIDDTLYTNYGEALDAASDLSRYLEYDEIEIETITL